MAELLATTFVKNAAVAVALIGGDLTVSAVLGEVAPSRIAAATIIAIASVVTAEKVINRFQLNERAVWAGVVVGGSAIGVAKVVIRASFPILVAIGSSAAGMAAGSLALYQCLGG